MIPSVNDEVEAYRKKGRINQDAMFEVLFGKHYSIVTTFKTPIDSSNAYLIDACMYADTLIADWVSNGVTEAKLCEGIEWALEEALKWRTAHLLPCVEGNEDPWHLRRYIVKCAESNFNARKDPSQRFDTRCIRICNKMKISQDVIDLIVSDIPYSNAAQFISGMTDDQIADAIKRTCKTIGYHIE